MCTNAISEGPNGKCSMNLTLKSKLRLFGMPGGGGGRPKRGDRKIWKKNLISMIMPPHWENKVPEPKHETSQKGLLLPPRNNDILERPQVV